METPTRQELYRAFTDYIGRESQRERSLTNRRMLGVLVWCFLVPAAVSAGILMLVKINMLPLRARAYLDWLVLVFPVAYSLYYLSAEVLRDLPATLRRGGIATTLAECVRQSEWRSRVSDELSHAVVATREDWDWILASFRIDLEAMQRRTRHLTALAGAVFFLIMQGIDTLAQDDSRKVTWMKDSVLGWIEATSAGDTTQMISLVLFLVLLYLSGSQTHYSLSRYLGAAELLVLQQGPARRQRPL